MVGLKFGFPANPVVLRRLLSVTALVSVLGAPSAFAGFVINATYTGFTAAQQADIASAVSLYEATFSDNITVNIGFSNMGSGLGQSQDAAASLDYNDFLTALTADAHGADDAAALAQLASNPITNNPTIVASVANWKALGFDTSGITLGDGNDGDIGLNANVCFTNHNSPVGGEYDLFAVACHEMDEVLGTVSGVGGSDLWAADLFRYNGSGSRSFTTDTSQHAYFSINGSTLLDEYNQFSHQPGDWGDWIYQEPQQVQDYAQSPGETINPNVEFRLLDVVGYDRVAPAPEPATLAILGVGLVGVIRRRRKS